MELRARDLAVALVASALLHLAAVFALHAPRAERRRVAVPLVFSFEPAPTAAPTPVAPTPSPSASAPPAASPPPPVAEPAPLPPPRPVSKPLPKPAPVTKPSPVAGPKHVTEPAPVAKPVPRPARPAVSSPAPPVSAAPRFSPTARADYEQRLFARLSRFKTYPLLARRRGLEGSGRLEVKIDRRGHVVSSRLLRRTPYPLLDRAALDMVAQADPFPPPPPDYVGDVFVFTAPVEYRLH